MSNRRSLAVRLVLVACAALVLFGIASAPVVTAAVVLNYFSVVWDPDLETVSISWETATEFETSGFTVERSTSPTGTFIQVGEFEPAVGDQVTGATYGPFFDTEVVTGTTYWYQLVVYDRSSQPDRTIPKVAIIAGNPSTPTPTNTPVTPSGAVPATNTYTPTPTATRTRTPTPTVTPLPTNTATRGPSPTRAATVPVGVTVTPIRSVANNGSATPTVLPPTSANNTLVASAQPVFATATLLSPLSTPTTQLAFNVPLMTNTPIPGGPVPTLVPTDATFVPVAPLIIATPIESANPTDSNDGTGGLLALIGAAGLMLLGGLYLILRQLSK